MPYCCNCRLFFYYLCFPIFRILSIGYPFVFVKITTHTFLCLLCEMKAKYRYQLHIAQYIHSTAFVPAIILSFPHFPHSPGETQQWEQRKRNDVVVVCFNGLCACHIARHFNVYFTHCSSAVWQFLSVSMFIGVTVSTMGINSHLLRPVCGLLQISNCF